MRIVFLKPKMIGDGLMLTPTLAAVRAAYPQAEIWVVVRRGCDGILAGCSAIDHIETIAAPFGDARNRWTWWHDLRTLLRLRQQKFDLLFELGDGHRARWFCLGMGARKAYSVQPATPLPALWRRCFDGIADFDWKLRHRVEKDYYSVSAFLKLPDEIPPMQFARDRTEPWPQAAAFTEFAVMHPGSRETYNLWLKEKWLEVAQYLLTRLPRLIISCGPGAAEREEARWLVGELGERAISTDGKLSWAQNAGLLYRTTLFVGNNTAAMHLAAACQAPIVALFGPSREEHWRPWRAAHRIVTPPEFAPGLGADGLRQRRTIDIPAAAVIAACEDLLAEQTRSASRR